MANYRYWVGILSCSVLFSLVFLGQQSGAFGSADHEHHGETGLLLFVIPGMIASYLSSKKRILCPLLGALYTLPLCLTIRHFWLTPYYSFWQELAYATSAVFWCVFGAMLALFARSLLQIFQQCHRRERQKGALSAFLPYNLRLTGTDSGFLWRRLRNL